MQVLQSRQEKTLMINIRMMFAKIQQTLAKKKPNQRKMEVRNTNSQTISFSNFFILDESFELHDVGNQPVATDLCDSYEESAMSEQSRCKYDSI